MDYSGPELTLKDLEARSPEVEEKLFELLRHKGFAILKLDKGLRGLFETLETQINDFFCKTSLAEKQQLCCEYETADKVCRERLELRSSFMKDAPYPLTACLRRNQFTSGFDVNTSPEAFHLLRSYFAGSHLQDVFSALEAAGHRICSAILRKLGIDFDDLLRQEQQLSDHGQLNLSASILRLLRYPKQREHSQDANSIHELAQDHTDLGLVTLMPCSEVPTLQVLDPETFDWIYVESNHNRGDLVVVVGEQMSFITNFAIPAVRHRVLQPAKGDRDRISFPFLQRLSPDVEIGRSGTNHKKKAKEVENYVFKLTPQLQHRVQAANGISGVISGLITAQSKHGSVMCSFFYSGIGTSNLPGLDSQDCIVFIVDKIPTRATFLALHKSLVTSYGYSSKSKYTKLVDWCFSSEVSVQVACLEHAAYETTLNLVFTTAAFWSDPCSSNHAGVALKEQMLRSDSSQGETSLLALHGRSTLLQLLSAAADNYQN